VGNQIPENPARSRRNRSARSVPLLFKRFASAGLVLFSLAHTAAYGQAPQPDLTKLNLQDLVNLEVTSVSKKAQRVSATAAAIFVITQEDISRSGALNIPDLLRRVPGLNVAQISASAWAISARGFNDHFTDKLLVMLDGRSVYTPTFSGVYWDGLDLPLEDIERIEIIRGPGGSSWGANAVNGVINIITKRASETHGGLLVAGGGNLQQGFGTVQYGSTVGRNTDYRIFGKYFNDTHMAALAGDDGADQWSVSRAGFRTDTKFSSSNSVTLEGDLYTGREGQIIPVFPSFTYPLLQFVTVAPRLSGGYLQSIWDHHYSGGSDSILQLSFDRYQRAGLLDEARNTFNIDFQDRVAWGSRHEIVLGAAFRDSGLNTTGTLAFSLRPPSLNTRLFSAFLQDEITLIPSRLSFTWGTKVEHNYYTGLGVMPSARVAWKLTDRAMAWTAISRAIRTPAAFDVATYANFGGYFDLSGTPIVFRLQGSPAVRDETLLAYEAGYRTALSNRLSFDVAAYYNSYSHLTTVEPMLPFLESSPSPPHVVATNIVSNLMHGETHGLETFATWRVTGRWSLTPSYAVEQMHFHPDRGSQDAFSAESKEGSTPHHWARLESGLNLLHGLRWNISSTFSERLPARAVPSCTRLDSNLTWSMREKLSLGIVGQNLLQDRHLEFVDTWQALASTQTTRSVFAKFTWTF
jgi:iron complex outermembrane recepter protein